MPGIDWGSQIVDQVNALITARGGVLVPDGLILVAYIFVIKTLLMIAREIWSRVGYQGYHHPPVNWGEVLIFVFQAWLVVKALQFWMVPIAGGLSLHQLPTALAGSITGTFDRATIDSFVGYVMGTIKNVQQPNPLQILDVLVYLYILLQMGILAAAMFVVSSFGFVGVGVYTVLGPLFIPLFLTRHFKAWGWNWLGGLFAFSMYRVMAAAIGWVWSNIMIFFFVHGVGTDYSIANWIVLAPIVVMLAFGFVYSMFKIPAMTSALFSGAGAIGQQYVNAIGSAARAAIAAL